VDGAACCLQNGLSCVKIVYADDEAGICGQIEQIDVLCKRRLDLELAVPVLERTHHGRDPAGVVGRIVS